uniref:Uncharacterized protein LOC108052166 isoform X2 n=1 Tax=Drosophila rhopaloa TaxID=1041015 RepID=A0A6P4FKQ5_DRORH
MTTASLPRVPEGLRDLMKVYTKEVLREKPADLYGYSANFFNVIVGEKSHQVVRKYEPVQTYETIMKNRVRQQVPLSLVFNIIPEKLTDLIKQFIKAVLREKPENIYIFAQEYFQRMSKEKSGRIEYTKYSTYEKSLKDKENVTPVSKVTCECGRILSAKTKDVENTASAYTDTKLAEADQSTFSSSISYLQSVVIIQRHFRRYLKQRNLGREKDKCNSVEYVAAILLIQRQVRRLLAKKRVEELKNSRDARKLSSKFNAADYMKAVVVIQRHYRIYLKRKQEQNRLKNGTVSLATAAIIIQRAFRRMVALHRAKRSASSAADQAEELNDNASETGSYTSVSTALLSTESTELGIANFEERVHQKIIHEDEEVDNDNVDVGLEKEFAEPIKGAEKSIQLKKSEILSGALIENMICKPNLENVKDFNNESKDLEVDAKVPAELENIKDFISESKDLEEDAEIPADLVIEAVKSRASQDQKPEIISNTASIDLESAAHIELKAKHDEEELELAKEAELKTIKDSLDIELETQDELKDKAPNLESKYVAETKPKNESVDIVEQEGGESKDPNLAKEIEKKENDAMENILKTVEDSSNNLGDEQEKSVKAEVTPTVSIEIEHVIDIVEDSILTHHDSNVDLVRDLSGTDHVADELNSEPTVEEGSFKTVLDNHNGELREQETINENNNEVSKDPLTPIKNEDSIMLAKNDSLSEHENKSFPKSRDKRSTEDKEIVQSNSESHESSIKGDFDLLNESDAILKPIIQDEVQISNDKALGESSETILATEDIPRTENETISGSTETFINNAREPLEEVVKPTIEEFTLVKDSQIDDAINDFKEIISKSIDTNDNSQIENELLKPDIKNIEEASDLSKAELENGLLDDLKAKKGELEILVEPETYKMDQNIEKSFEKSDYLLENIKADNSSDETEILQSEIRKLSNQETLLIGSESLETENISSVEGDIFITSNSEEPKAEFHNFGVFIEGMAEKDKNNRTDTQCTNEAAIADISESMGEITVPASTVIVDDSLIASVEHEFKDSVKNGSEGSDTQTENIEDNKETKMSNASESGHSTKISIDDSIIDNKIAGAEDETLPIESETMLVKDKKQVVESIEVDNISNEESKSLQLEVNVSDTKTLPINSGSEKVGDSELKHKSTELDSFCPELTEETKNISNTFNDEKSETTEKVLSTSEETKHSSELVDSHKRSKEDIENSTQPNEREMSIINTVLAVMEVSDKNETVSQEFEDKEIAVPDDEDTLAVKNKESDSIIEEMLDKTKPESALEKKKPDEGPTAALLEDESPDPETKPKKDDSTDLESSSAAVEDKCIGESKPKTDSPAASTSEKNSSLLVSNQLIGTQNLPTNHIEIEKNTKKLSSPSVKDKDIGTLTLGRLVPTPIAELQLKSFKTPNDDGAWYDIYMEPKITSEKDSDNTPSPVQIGQPDTSSVGEEPTIVAERSPSYYTPKEIVEAVVPKAKNSVSFFISFDPDDGKPKYKIPKKFRDQPKKDTMKEIIKIDDIQSESEVDSNDEEIEVIEVSEGDPEYQQIGGSKLQTILELDNENEQPTEISNENSALEPELEDSSIRNINKVESKMEKVNSENISVPGNEKLLTQSTKSDIERYELAYNTDISRMTRSVQIIERAYKRFTNKRSLNSEPDHESAFSKQNGAAIIIQKWVRESLRKRSLQVSSDISQKSKESLAAKKIQRAFRRYVEKTTERKSASKHFTKKEETAALVIQKAIRLYLQRNYVEPNKTQFPDKTEFEQNQAAEKIQRAYRRYLKLAGKSEKIGESQSQELQEVDNPVDDISTPIQLLNPSEEKEIVVYKSEELQNIEKPLKASLSSTQFLKSTDNPEIMNELQTEELQEVEGAAETISNQILISNLADEPKMIKEEKANELRELENPLKDIENPLKARLSLTQNQKSSDNSVFMKESQTEELQEVEKAAETISNQILMSNLANEPKIIKKVKNSELRELDNLSKDTLLSSSFDGPETITEVQSIEQENSLKASQLYTPKLADEIINVFKADELEGENLAKVISSPKLADQPKETISDELIELKNSLKDNSSPIHMSKAAEEPEIIIELHSENLQETENLAEANSSPIHSPKLADQPKETLSDELIELKHSLKDNSSPIPMSKAAEDPEIIGELQSENLQETENLAEANSSPIHPPKLADQLKETMSDELIELKHSRKDNSSPILMFKAADEPEIISELQSENLQETESLAEANSSPIHTLKLADSTQKLQDLQIEEELQELDKHAEANSNQVQDRPEIIMELDRDELKAENSHAETNSSLIYSSKDEPDGKSSAASVIQRAFRQYMERKKLENFDETSFDSITSSRITAIETSNYQTAGTPLESLVKEPTDEPIEDASKGSQKSEWFVGSTRIIPSQGVVEEHLGVETDPDPAAITSKTELNTSTQVESVETVDRTHGSLESKLTPGISSSKIDESVGSASEKDNAVSSGLAGLTKSSEAGLGSGEDPLLLSQSDFGGIVHSLDIASTQELVNNFLENEIEYSSKQGPFLPQEVKEEPCVKKSASLVNLSEGESEPDLASQKAENTDSSASENTGLDTLSADTIDKATIKLSKPEEVIEKMSQLRDSKSHDRLPSADPSFDESVVRPMSSLQEQYSLDIEDGDIIVYNRLQRDETRESSAQSDSVVFGEAVAEKIQDKDLLNEEESGRVHLMRHYTIAGDDPRGLFRSVTIDDALSFVEVGGKDMGINSTNSFCLDDETSENIRKKMMAYSLSETDSDYFDPRKTSKEDFDVDTAMADDMGTSTETESTIVSAATKIQAGARGFLTRRRLRRASAGTKSSTLDTKASFGNDAISESLERFIEEEAAKKIQAAYRMHTRKRKVHNRKIEGISLESNLAARRQKLQRGDALRNDSTPDEESSVIASGVQAQKSSKLIKSKTVGEAKLKADMELKWLKMRQNSMPVQIDCEVFRVIPKHMRKRIKSAEANKRK